MELNIKEVKEAMESMKTSTKTYAQAVLCHHKLNQGCKNRTCSKTSAARKTKTRNGQIRSHTTVKQNTETEEMKWRLIAASSKEITAQDAIEKTDNFNDNKPKLQGINKLQNNSIRLQCKSEEAAKQL